MKLLALDTSSLACSVALQVGAERIESHEEQPREHTRLLLPMIRSLLNDAGVALTDLDAIVLGNGPGSFIGMRIATSVAQGLAFGAALPVAPVSSMAAVAARVFAGTDASVVVIAQDAHMREVYLGVYGRDADDLPRDIVAERLHGLGPIPELEASPPGHRVAAGYGWQRYPELRTANCEQFATFSDAWYPHAADLLGLGAAAVAAGSTVAPEDLVPAYLRHKVAAKPPRGS